MRKWILAAAIVIAGLSASQAQAAGGTCRGPFCNAAHPAAAHHGLFGSSCYGYLCHKNAVPLPVYQAAPWYLYWPYDAHFMTPAPVQGMFYPPPTHGGGMISQPYFPLSPVNSYPMSYPYGYAR